MTLIERLFALRALAPFDRLTDTELAIVARACTVRRYQPGHLLLTADKPLRALFITVQGGLCTAAGTPLPPVFSHIALISGEPIPQAVHAAAGTGATCLLLSKGHFFTLLHECPELALGYVDMAVPAGGAA